MLGKKHSEEAKRKMSIARLKQNPQPFAGKKHSKTWKVKLSKKRRGIYFKETVKMRGLHDRMRIKIPKSKLCQDCKKRPSFDLTNISQQYKEDISDWEWLCRSCHMRKDGRIKNLKNQ